MSEISIELLKGSYNVNPDIVFNRFDLIYGNNKYIHIKNGNCEWTIPFRIDGDTGYLGLYLVDMTKDVFNKLIRFVFKYNKKINRVFLKKSRNNYCGYIRQGNHYRLELPDTFDSLLGRMNKKGRYNYNREKRLLEGKGKVEYMHWSRENIPVSVIEAFFSFKSQTYGRNYNMRPEEYIKKYFVSDVYSINVDGAVAGVALACEQCECVFLENLSYDTKYSKYSVGFQTYLFFLNEMIKKRKQQVYLGGGDYDYKKKFNSIEEITYEGYVYRNIWRKIYSVIENRVKKKEEKR